ncbi:D-amino-acid transaminase [Parasphingorhabdus halotolerans]|uniref:Probable branched-chain-amino-acid aminotransferase n=1 Tax=Parasphingorhabdus halotolerans TaxID=2725558 RepID=A0A6H2DQ54_9SPHN|nr:D-amino-acid transaminase [Parasphingorhabdus halotolerans]QJB70520.1 D-amino-acid transaminase [Parasphingorhabdus halotolerans]
MRLIYLNGNYVTENDAKVSVFDRGLLFSDAVYEVISVIGGCLIDMERHEQRLMRSLGELSINADEGWSAICLGLVSRNALDEGLVYLQISRGAVPERDYRWPSADIKSTVFAFTQERALIDNPMAERGMRIVTRPDMRWGRCDIKTTQLLYASLMKMEARDAGADDAWMTRDAMVTEGTSQNAHIITKDGVLISHQLDHRVLPGVTRIELFERAGAQGLSIQERAFSVAEAYDAAEAFVSSSTLLIMPVVSIDGHMIGDGKPGGITEQLRRSYISEVQRTAAS